MSTITFLLSSILHIDVTLVNFINMYGDITYLILFLIIFCETGLVILPFLPGDSLLFAAGSLAANNNNQLELLPLFLLLLTASILGNQVNYFAGKYIGPHLSQQRLITSKFKFINFQHHLQTAEKFYEKHGGKTIILGRFLPIIRTFTPFVAGLVRMSGSLFATYNVIGAFAWIGSLLLAGFYLGSFKFVQEHFNLFIYAIIFLTIIPSLLSYLCQHLRGKTS